MKSTVFDLLNCGPRHRFVVRGPDKKPFIVSNCTQAVARDIFAEGILRLEAFGIPVVFHVHDEVICEVPEGFDVNRVIELLTTNPSWAKTLPIAAEGDLSPCYKK